MFCKNCGKKIPDNSKFCDSCGHKIDSHDKQIKEDDKTSDKDVKELSGFSGWLALFGLGIAISPFAFIFNLIQESTEYGFDVYTYTIYLILIVSASWINYLMFTRKKTFKKWFLGFAILNIAVALLIVIGANSDPYLFTQEEITAADETFARSILYGIIWTSYLWVSKRAKNTFIN